MFFHQATIEATVVNANEITSVSVSLLIGNGLLPAIASALLIIANTKQAVLIIVPFDIFSILFIFIAK